jgi:UDP:flavonoid glycosyltransferase YjiC (YdhE family)
MRILVAAMPFAGHATPMRAVARALVGRGHEVVAYTGRRYGTGFVDAGAELATWRHAPDFDDRDLRATFPQLTSGRGPRAVMTNLEHVFLRTGEGQARDIVAAGPFDVLVSDHLALGSVLAAEMTGTPVATVALVPLSMPSQDLPPAGLALAPAKGWAGRTRDSALRRAGGLALRRLDRVLVEVRASLGLPPPVVAALDAFWSSQLVIAHGSAALEYPRRDLPRQVHFVGQLSAPTLGSPLPPWWDEVTRAGRRVVHVTQGTYDVDPRDLLLPTLRGLASLDVQVLAATGGPPLPATTLPVDAHQAAFLPYDRLLPRTSVMVTNGGWGGVLAALAAGVPLVVAGGTLDKPDIARRVAWSGAGLDLRTGSPSPRRVRAAVRRVLDDPGFRTRAEEIGRSLAHLGGAATAARLVEQLGGSRRPVLRSRDPWHADD